MSIEIITTGILDTIQDDGRYGHSASGINPGGVMDRIAAAVANYLVGNAASAAVIELHYPAASVRFTQTCIIAISGADHSPLLNEKSVPLNTALIVPANAVLRFTRPVSGMRSYIAVQGGLDIPVWLDSYSTNLKAQCGGMNGRRLMEGDVIPLKQTSTIHPPVDQNTIALPWHADVAALYNKEKTIRIISGREYALLTDCAGTIIEGNTFTISMQSDRMGYRMNGSPLQLVQPLEMISSAVTRGTIQLLPNGQLIILMADHQATGGYPRLAHVISADLPTLAQLTPNTAIRFEMVQHEVAEQLLLQQYHHLQQIKTSCAFRLHEWMNLAAHKKISEITG